MIDITLLLAWPYITDASLASETGCTCILPCCWGGGSGYKGLVDKCLFLRFNIRLNNSLADLMEAGTVTKDNVKQTEKQNKSLLNNLSIASFSWDKGKQISPRCDVVKCGVPSGAILFAEVSLKQFEHSVLFMGQRKTDRPRCDAVKCGVPSGAILFAEQTRFSSKNEIKTKNSS